MYDADRKTQILEYIRLNGKADVNTLASMFYVSAASVRRDLTELQKLGLVKRTHGGALYNISTDETSLSVRQTENILNKESAVAVALKHIPNFESAFIDNSSTCLMLAQKLDLHKKTIVTNGLRLASMLARHGSTKVIIPGGTVTESADSVTGSITTEAVRNYKFDIAFISCAALDRETTFERSLDTAVLKRAAIQRSKYKYLIFDSAKLERHAPYMSTDLSTFDYIVTDSPDAEIVDYVKLGYRIYNK